MIIKKYILCVLFSITCLVCCACSLENNENNIIDNEIRTNNFPTYEEIQEEYKDKTVLVWAIEETGYERNNPFRTKEINQYLNEHNYNFVVCFYPIRRNNDLLYTQQLSNIINEGNQIDIIFSSFTYIEEPGGNAYHKYVYNGLFEPLDEYLKTDIGKKLYEIMPEKHWEGLKVNNRIYGIDGGLHTLSDDYGYFVNYELSKKYGFDIGKPIDEQFDILKNISVNENCDIFALYPNYSVTSYFADIKEITGAVWLDETENTVKSILDNETYIDRLRLFYNLNKEHLLCERTGIGNSSFFIMQDNISGGNILYHDKSTIEVDYNGNAVLATPVFNEQTSVRSAYMATGICSKSQNKEKAFELLAITQIDPVLNNLLTYGVENVDYNLNDNFVDNIINEISLDRFANKMICYQSTKSNITSTEYARIFSNAKLHNTEAFAFDGRNCVDESFKTSSVIADIFINPNISFEDSLTQYREELEKAGISKLIDECNKQYMEYTNE